MYEINTKITIDELKKNANEIYFLVSLCLSVYVLLMDTFQLKTDTTYS